MKILLTITLALVASSSGRVIHKEIEASEVCYEHYGCFGTEAPYTSLIRPLRSLPNAPYEVGTRYVLFTRGSHDNEQVGYELYPDKDAIIKFSDFKSSRKTYVLIHGFTDNGRVDWITNTKNLLLQNEDVNIITVDWEAGAKPSYLKASANARMAGAMIARMLTYLEQKAELNVDDIHVISHSLGGHVAGYAGERLMGRINRITAIDPMDLYFGGADPLVRLDTTDAKLVEVIHTNGNALNNMGLGIPGAIGHIDIYPNGGSKQPGCKDTLGNLVGSIIDLVTLDFEGSIASWACSHARGAHYYAESIAVSDSCPFVSFQCKNQNQFENGECYQECSEPGKCAPLGYNAKNHPAASGVYYLHTTDGANNNTFCKQVLKVTIPISVQQEATMGHLALTFQGDDGTKSEKFHLADNVKIQPCEILQLWVEVPHKILQNAAHKPSLILRYTRGGLLPGNQAKTLAIESVNLAVIAADLTTSQSTYSGAVLDYATDVVISE